ncbi:hypothetical protein ACYCJX_08840 [Staphylococcus borealis]|uniref:hypothetical protein n=1 Tax=Staphylococcus borealis TaxID=2742203 RepID=UPI000FEDFC82|nr:hypothetical protein [Staphylococcus borealis]MDM7863232.1 hypothetical protein [Staphylococcus borealis]MDM7882118.1 hypothetical protein [Staphylococcus borealis]RIO91174.1 hypothetical protein BUZ39_07215 [Staphylococcus haemolyticus]
MDEITKIIKCLRELLNKNTGYKISKGSGLPYQTVQDLKNGKTSIEDARFRMIRKLYNYKKELEQSEEI